MKKSKLTLRCICEGAIFIALATVLSMLPVWKMPQGGSFDLAMLPILIFCVRWGFGPSLAGCFVYSVIQFMLDGGFAIGWQSIIGDYLVAYTVLALAGLFKGRKNGFFIGTVVACIARFLVHYVVGATLWASYMPEEFFNMTMTTPWFYSALYNGAYMLIDMAAILVVGALLWKPLGKYLRGEDISKA